MLDQRSLVQTRGCLAEEIEDERSKHLRSRVTGLSAKYLKLPVWTALASPNAGEAWQMGLPHSSQKTRVTAIQQINWIGK